MTTSGLQGGRLEGVDVLRGLSVLLVTLHHIHLRYWLNDYPVNHVLPDLLNRVTFWSGYYAVIIFFVISGFLITRLSIARWGQLGKVHVGRFYVMRAARILPCLFALLLILSVLHLAGAKEFMIEPERASLGQALSAALMFRINWLEGHYGYLPGSWDILWSLSVEETFYLAFPLMCLLLRREWLLLLPLGCLLVLGPLNRIWYLDQDPWGHYAYLSCMDGIAFGCLAALACARLQISKRVLLASLIVGAITAILVIVGCDEDSIEGIARYGLNVTLLEAGMALMLVALGSGVGNHALSRGTGWLRLLGRASYEIYLVHMLIVLGLIGVFKQIQRPTSEIPLWYAAMLLLSLALGYGVFRGFSEPLNEWLRGKRSSPPR
jgi:peptidoglycan/LPS O-acetylase OafA/YrhL